MSTNPLCPATDTPQGPRDGKLYNEVAGPDITHMTMTTHLASIKLVISSSIDQSKRSLLTNLQQKSCRLGTTHFHCGVITSFVTHLLDC